MSALEITRTEFTDVFGVAHNFEISPDWKVTVDSRSMDNLNGFPAVILGGVAIAMDSVATHQELFDISYTAYLDLVKGKYAKAIPGINGRDLRSKTSEHIGRISRNALSPLRTNMFPVIVGATQRKFLILSDSFDESFAVSKIRSSHFSDNESADRVFKKEAEESFLRRRINLIKTGKSVDERNKKAEEEKAKNRSPKPSRETIERLEKGVVEVKRRIK